MKKHSDFLNSLSIHSMSFDLPDTTEHYKNMLMWAHYAEGYTRFCLQFSATNFFE
jgi:hypothetical protein